MRRVLVSLVFLSIVSAIPLWAQSESATVSGRVSDSSGAAIRQADVVLTNADTNVEERTTTNDVGLYVFTGVRPGRYRIVAGATGFKTLIKEALTLHVQDELSENFLLSVGSVSETVSVSADAAPINTTDASVSTVIDSKFVENMPLNGRSIQSLILLTPGITVVPGAFATTQGEFSVNGQRTETNYYTVDGVSANTGVYNVYQMQGTPQETQLGTTQTLVGVDALQEFRISTSTYSSEYGRSPGAQISLQTRSGANQWHGSAFDYFRNDDLDSNNWFNDQADLPKTAERQNDFGGTMGGPVRIPGVYNGKDKTFFFFSYEGLRLINPHPALTVKVPDALLRTASPAAILPLVDQFPIANGADLNDGTALFTASYSSPSSLNSYGIRIDHTFSPKLSIFGRFADTPSSTVSRGGDFVGLDTNTGSVKSLTIGATSVFSPRITNEFRFNYTQNNGANNDVEDTFGGAIPLTFAKVMPGITPPKYSEFSSFFSFLGSGGGIQTFLNIGVVPSNQWNITDNLSSTFGSHTLKYGFDYRHQTGTVGSSQLTNDFFYFSPDEVLNNAAFFDDVTTSGPVNQKGFYTNFSAFVQDEWKATTRLHLSVGVRWEINPPPSSNVPTYALTQATNLDTTTVAPRGTPLYHTDYHAFAPRLGVAYGLSQKPGSETVIRAGFGVFYDLGNANALLGTTLAGNSNFSFPGLPFPFTPAEQVIASQKTFQPPYPNVDAPDPNLKLPYTLDWNVAIQRQLGGKQTLSVTYVGSGGRKLLQSSNLLLPNNPNILFDPQQPSNLTLIRNASTSGYNSLQVQFQRRLSRGLEALANYTWSHSIDDLSSNGNFTNGHGINNVLLRASSDFDVRHNFSAALMTCREVTGIGSRVHFCSIGGSICVRPTGRGCP